MFHARRRRERKLSMLTQGALRQRRRRAMESAEERRDRLARDAERKRIKRMSESAEEAAWRRTVDAMRKKEKRMKERETKAMMAVQYGTQRIKADVSSDSDPVMRVVRPFPRKRRPRHMPCVGDYLLSFPDGMADITEFGGSRGLAPILGDFVGGSMPSTSGAPYVSNGASCCPPSSDEMQRKAHCVAATGLWCSDVGTPMVTAESFCGDEGVDAERKVFGAVVGAEEDFADSSPDESLSALSPEVIISEVKPEPLENDDDDQLSDERIRDAALSALSPEVIIREVRIALPPGVGDGHCRRASRAEDGHQLCGHWIASSAVTVNAISADDRPRDCTGAAICGGGRPREDFVVSV